SFVYLGKNILAVRRHDRASLPSRWQMPTTARARPRVRRVEHLGCAHSQVAHNVRGGPSTSGILHGDGRWSAAGVLDNQRANVGVVVVVETRNKRLRPTTSEGIRHTVLRRILSRPVLAGEDGDWLAAGWRRSAGARNPTIDR